MRERARHGQARLPAALLAACIGLAATRATAQAHEDPMGAAEEAFTRVDFDAVHQRAQRAREHGGLTRAQLSRAWFLTGVAAAALGRADEAREAYTRVLAFDPSGRPDRGLSPALRSPFLEARGYWSGRTDRLEMRAAPDAAGEALVVRVSDPVAMGRTLQVEVRAPGQQAYRVVRAPAAAEVRVPLAPQRAADAEVRIALLDEHDNRVAELGSEVAPWTARPRADPADPGGAPGASTRPAVRSTEGVSPLVSAGAVLGGVGLVGLVVGAVASAQREGFAAEWNADACLANGRTREENCAPRRSSAETWGSVAIVSYVAGGALLGTGAVLLGLGLAGRSRETNARASLTPRCAPTVGLGLGLACASSF